MMRGFKKFKDQLPMKEKQKNLFTGKKLVVENMIIFLRFRTDLK